MSIGIMSYVWDNFKGTHGELLILLALADYSNDGGVSWPYTKTLAKKAQCSQSTLFSALSKFEKDGWIRRINREGESNIYQVITPDTEGIQFSDTYPELDTTPPSNRIPSIKNHKEPLIDKTKELTQQQKMVGALAKVLNGNATLMGPRLGRFASQMIKVGATPDKLLEMYCGPDCWWFKHTWQGLKGQYPNEADIRRTWDHWVIPVVQSGPCIDDLMKP
jgi:hypothetical protein